MRSTWIAVDSKSRQLLAAAQNLAATASTLLIRGETGTGKDLLASIIHLLGPNNEEPLLKVDCANLPASLLEAELFGCGAASSTAGRRGRLEMAGRGTVVLDEVSALPMPLQSRLLHAIEEKRLNRAGDLVPLEARLIMLTNVDLEHAVSRRTFREDLYYRLNLMPMTVPPLRERRADIAPLACHFAEQLSDLHRKPRLTFTPAALAALEHYSFPGNVRELRTLLERTVIESSAPALTLEDFPRAVREASADGSRKMSLEELERAYIIEILGYTQGKKSRAAHILGISRKTLLEKRKRYGLQ